MSADLYCSRCGTALEPGGKFCPACSYSVKAKKLTDVEGHLSLIAAMWILTFAYFPFAADRSAGGDIGASLCGFSSFVLSLWLLAHKNRVDRTHGAVRMGISLVMGLIAYTTALHRL